MPITSGLLGQMQIQPDSHVEWNSFSSLATHWPRAVTMDCFTTQRAMSCSPSTGTLTRELARSTLSPIAYMSSRQASKAWVPGCDDFSLMFNTCDHFNRELHDTTFLPQAFRWPSLLPWFPPLCHSSHAYLASNGIPHKDMSCQESILAFSEQLYVYGASLDGYNV